MMVRRMSPAWTWPIANDSRQASTHWTKVAIALTSELQSRRLMKSMTGPLTKPMMSAASARWSPKVVAKSNYEIEAIAATP